MKHPRQLFRIFYINYVIARHGLDQILLSAQPFSPFRFLKYFNPWNWRRKPKYPRGVAIRLSLEDLGPIFVKFGQILSTRPDLLPEDIIVELQKLQDQVPPFSGEEAKIIVEQNFKKPITQIFKFFALNPFASASIAQVHEAILFDGRRVVVKIQRPGIKTVIKRDVGLLLTIADLAERFWSHGRRLRPRELVREFEQSITDELDFMREAANASQLRRNFENSNLLYVPEIIWDYTTSDIIVMERISGIPVSDRDALIAAGINLKQLAERGVEIFFTQVFRDSFFHADMHPGNIFVADSCPEDPQYLAVDFGIMGILSPKDHHYLAENFLAFFRRDYRQVAVLHIESGWVPPTTRVEEFESAIRSVCEPIFQKPLADISFAQLLLRLFQTASRFKMEIQPQLFLLQKTLFNIEGLGRKLYPELDLWSTAKPFLERWMRKQYSTRALLKNVIKQMPSMVDNLMAIPSLWRDILEYDKHLQMAATWQSKNTVVKVERRRNTKSMFLNIGITLLGVVGFTLLLPNITIPTFWYGSLGAAGVLSLLIAANK